MGYLNKTFFILQNNNFIIRGSPQAKPDKIVKNKYKPSKIIIFQEGMLPNIILVPFGYLHLRLF